MDRQTGDSMERVYLNFANVQTTEDLKEAERKEREVYGSSGFQI